MPPYSTIRTFVEALQTGRTNITRALDELLENPGSKQNDPDFPHMRSEGALNGMPGWLRGRLTPRLRPPEIDHIGRWPDAQKEKARREIVTSINDDRHTTFEWEVYAGPTPSVEVRPGPSGGVVIVFRSPRAGLRLVEPSSGEVVVED